MPDATGQGTVLRDIHERRTSIINNTPGVILIDANPSATAYDNIWYTMSAFEEVTANKAAIEAEAKVNDLDPDFVKAIVWLESTHGYYDRINPKNETIRPMNVHAILWAGLGVTREKLNDPKKNIKYGTLILARIWSRTSNPDIEKVATLYNALGATKVSGYGKTVASYADSRPWIEK